MGGNKGCLYIYPGSSFDKIAARLEAIPLSDSVAQDAISRLFASIYNLEEDGQGRALIPADLRESTGLKKNIVFVGSLNKIELWDADVYAARTKVSGGGLEKVMGDLKNYGI